ncbi:hypothetical protein HerbRD11066_64440 [Herbidospora sp. RD11066]
MKPPESTIGPMPFSLSAPAPVMSPLPEETATHCPHRAPRGRAVAPPSGVRSDRRTLSAGGGG